MSPRRQRERPPWSFTPPPPGREPHEWLKGSAAILRFLAGAYPDREVGPGVLVAVLLDKHSILVGQARVRNLPDDVDLPRAARLTLLLDLLTALVTAHPAGSAGFACLLVTIRSGPHRLTDSDIRWWTVLDAISPLIGLHAADVLVSAPDGWLTVRAGRTGRDDWPPHHTGQTSAPRG